MPNGERKINMESCHDCGCIGYGYVPIQELKDVFSAEDALKNGSLFPELVLTIEEYGKVCKQTGGIL